MLGVAAVAVLLRHNTASAAAAVAAAAAAEGETVFRGSPTFALVAQ